MKSAPSQRAKPCRRESAKRNPKGPDLSLNSPIPTSAQRVPILSRSTRVVRRVGAFIPNTSAPSVRSRRGDYKPAL
jgi:hypothetical protein